MTRRYGVDCCYCRQPITSPGSHNRLQFVNMLIPNPERTDVCPSCTDRIRAAIRKEFDAPAIKADVNRPLVCVAIPSRGLQPIEQTQMIVDNFAEVSAQFPGANFTFKSTYKLPLPISHNLVIKRALETNAQYIWLLEDDVIPTTSLLLRMMLQLNCDVVSVDYPLGHRERSIKTSRDGVVFNSGVGCMLIKDEILKRIGEPWFDDRTFNIMDDGEFVEMPHKIPCKLDVTFIKRLRDHNISIKAIYHPACDHIRIKELGQRGVDSGCHQLERIQ